MQCVRYYKSETRMVAIDYLVLTTNSTHSNIKYDNLLKTNPRCSSFFPRPVKFLKAAKCSARNRASFENGAALTHNGLLCRHRCVFIEHAASSQSEPMDRAMLLIIGLLHFASTNPTISLTNSLNNNITRLGL